MTSNYETQTEDIISEIEGREVSIPVGQESTSEAEDLALADDMAELEAPSHEKQKNKDNGAEIIGESHLYAVHAATQLIFDPAAIDFLDHDDESKRYDVRYWKPSVKEYTLYDKEAEFLLGESLPKVIKSASPIKGLFYCLLGTKPYHVCCQTSLQESVI